MKQYSAFIYLVVYLIWCGADSLPNDDVITIRERVLNLMLLPSKANMNETVYNALIFTHSLNSSCYWPDIIYNDTRVVQWRTAEHLVRITTMLQAIIVNGSMVENDPEIRAAVHCALNVWLVNDWRSPNWYHNEIYVPILATGQLLMLGDNATNFETEKITDISYRAAWWYNKPRDVSANVVWMIQAEIYRSLATYNLTGLEQGFSRMWDDVAIQSADTVGIQYDWSYHFHGTQLLNGAYGMSWSQNIFAFIVCSQQTKYAPTEQQFSIFVQFITKGSAWMTIGKTWDWHPIGRAVSRPDKEYYVFFDTRYIRELAEIVELNDSKIDLRNFADRLDGFPNASVIIGNKHYFVSDYQIHHRKNWTSAIKMQSIRTQPIECNNGENIKAELSGQGVLNLYTGYTYDYEDIFPLLDWQAINGMTVEHGIPLEPCINASFLWQNTSFVGGVSDDLYGLAMMDTATHNLTAQRSWHFYDDAIIALATNITLTTQTTAWTTLASRILKDGKLTVGFFNSTVITISDGNYSFPYVQEKTLNIQWIHVGESNIAYLFPEQQQQYTTVGIMLGNRTGNYNTIGAFNVTVSARILTIWIEHGLGSFINLAYNYMILPNVSRESVPLLIKQYEDEQLFSCLSTNNHFHGIIWPSLKRASFVLWENITTTFSCKSPLFEINIQLNDAGAYLFSETTNDFRITVSHPMRISGNINVIVDRIGSGQGCMPSSSVNATATNITLSLPSSDHLLGASVNVKCNK